MRLFDSSRKIWAGAFACGLMASASVFAGGMDSGGGDIHAADYGAAWFLGDREIRYCLDIAPDFGVAKAEIESAVELAFSKWKTYIEERAVNRNVTLGERLVLNRKRVTCEGSEDLKFYFGSADVAVEKAKERFSQPVALAYRSSYDLKKLWGSGFIWIAKSGGVSPGFPDWSLPNRMLGMLMHELGHVMGCEHVSRTIMDENLASMLQFSSEFEGIPIESLFSNIDGKRALYVGIPDGKGLEYSGTLGPKESVIDAPATFARLLGRASVGAIHAKVRLERRFASMALADSLGEKVFVLFDDRADNASKVGGVGLELAPRIFKRTKWVDNGNGSTGTEWRAFSNMGSVVYLTIPGIDGTRYPLIVESNMNTGPIRLRYFHEGTLHELFYTNQVARLVP